MNAVNYTVTATLPDEPTAQRYARWLIEGHAAAVVAWGGESAEIARLDPESPGGSPRVECRYRFTSRAVLDHYFQEGAPALRAEGLRLFGPESGVRFERRIGDLLAVVKSTK